MKQVLGEITRLAKEQGFAIGLLFIAILWMNSHNTALEDDIKKCNEDLIENYKTVNNEVIRSLDENCELIMELKEELKFHNRNKENNK